MRPIPEKDLDVFELELAIKWAHGASLMDTNPEVSHLFDLNETALKEKLERLKSATPPNNPLTMEELREMDGEPVFIKRIGSDHPDDRAWALVDVGHELCKTVDGVKAFFEFYGKSWLAYRRKPEEGTT